MLERIIPFAHNKIKEYLTVNDVAVDATCGNGNDTLFLSKLSKHVYAFDIQEAAINNTSKLLKENNISNVSLIHDSHESFTKHDLKDIKVIMYNLGYLPGANKDTVTTYKTTINSITNGLTILQEKGLLSITVYIGHKQGKIESEKLLEFVTTLDSKKYNVLIYRMLNKNNSPYNIFIEKLR